MSTVKQLYPLSTPSEQSVPLDVIRPTFLQTIAFTEISASSVISLPANSEILLLRASATCVIQFGNTAATVPVSGAPAIPDCLLLEEGEIQAVSLPVSITSLSVIGISSSGTLYIQGVESWKSLGLEMYQTRI